MIVDKSQFALWYTISRQQRWAFDYRSGEK